MPADDGAFERDFRALWALSFRVARHVVDSRDDAEDVAAEALARLHASWGRVGGQPWREAWLTRVTTNVALDQLRRRRRLVGMAPAERAEPADDAVVARLALADALARLPRRQREVVVLRHLAGLPEQQVADQLRVSVGSVKRHSHRALQKLSGLLAAPEST
ncbi:MAG TPA: sigma-70 family RNA polymerase sigma factor [Acidimicrobiales bacterium]|nr:sigma-70 family RNA polymerase sigma factor [Acidimicrobiales bacterium]